MRQNMNWMSKDSHCCTTCDLWLGKRNVDGFEIKISDEIKSSKGICNHNSNLSETIGDESAMKKVALLISIVMLFTMISVSNVFAARNYEIIYKSSYSEGLAVVETSLSDIHGTLFGYVDEKNNVVIEPQFTEAYPFHKGYALVLQLDRPYYMYTLSKINKSGEIVQTLVSLDTTNYDLSSKTQALFLFNSLCNREKQNFYNDISPSQETEIVQEVQPQITVNVLGKRLNFDVNPVVQEGRTLVPVRQIFEALNLEVDWDSNNQSLTAYGPSKSIVIIINNKTAHVDGRDLEMDVPAMIIKGRTMVPIRFIGESIGMDVKWDDDSKTVYILEKKPIVTDPITTFLLNSRKYIVGKSTFNELFENESSLLSVTDKDNTRNGEGKFVIDYTLQPSEKSYEKITIRADGITGLITSVSVYPTINSIPFKSNTGLQLSDPEDRVITLYGENMNKQTNDYGTVTYTITSDDGNATLKIVMGSRKVHGIYISTEKGFFD